MFNWYNNLRIAEEKRGNPKTWRKSKGQEAQRFEIPNAQSVFCVNDNLRSHSSPLYRLIREYEITIMPLPVGMMFL